MTPKEGACVGILEMMRKLNSVSVLLLAAVALTFINSPLYAADKTAPNFIIMYMDDLGWADTSVAMMDGEPLSKNDFYQTPHLEKLAARGIRFSNGYCPDSNLYGVPGQYPIRNDLGENTGPKFE